MVRASSLTARLSPANHSEGPACIARIRRLHEYLSTGRSFTAESFVREWSGISSRTIKRDIEHLRDFHNAPVEWNASRRTYYYTRPYDTLQLSPLPRINADEALALILAGRTFAAWRGSTLGRTLAAVLEKMAPALGSAISLDPAELNRLVYEPDSNPEIDAATDAEQRHLVCLLDAIHNHRELRITYKKPRARRPVPRLIHPLHLAILEHRWLLVAHDMQRRALRNFLLSRIEKITTTGATFTPPPDFDAHAHLTGNMGLFTGERANAVRIQFDATAAPYIRERPWHASQTIRDLTSPRGAIEVTLHLNNLIDVRRRILGWGRHARALSPAALVRSIKTEAAALAVNHTQPSSARRTAKSPLKK
ncbi:WYL domain-containing protein [Opitutaceae bacterium TAV4]|nr:WYL domain-containing protein [Opitutaceae bacterium TAV4]RRJ98795.1 WYL domain-containing protein [Opitutaceae bacterium TAV3]